MGKIILILIVWIIFIALNTFLGSALGKGQFRVAGAFLITLLAISSVKGWIFIFNHSACPRILERLRIAFTRNKMLPLWIGRVTYPENQAILEQRLITTRRV
jgi:hypothetical protein